MATILHRTCPLLHLAQPSWCPSSSTLAARTLWTSTLTRPSQPSRFNCRYSHKLCCVFSYGICCWLLSTGTLQCGDGVIPAQSMRPALTSPNVLHVVLLHYFSTDFHLRPFAAVGRCASGPHPPDLPRTANVGHGHVSSEGRPTQLDGPRHPHSGELHRQRSR